LEKGTYGRADRSHGNEGGDLNQSRSEREMWDVKKVEAETKTGGTVVPARGYPAINKRTRKKGGGAA